MSLFNRATDILTANLHEMLDRFENPERMLRQAVREIEQACEVAMDAAAKAIAQERLLMRRTDALQAEVARWQQRAASALSRGDEAAAREAVSAKLRQQELAELCERQQEAVARDAARLRHELFQLRGRQSEARQLMELHIARNRMTVARRTFVSAAPTARHGQSILARFERTCERIEQAEAESLAAAELTLAADEVDLTEHDLRVELELEAFRAESAAGEVT